MRHIPSISTVASLVVLCVTVACVFVIGIKKPTQDWDIIAYVASAYQLDGLRGQELLERTYADVRSDVSDDKFKTLTEGDHPGNLVESHYRKTVYSDPVALAEQIPFYSIKIVYVELLRSVRHLGISYSKSTYMVSAVFSALGVVALSRVLYFAKIHFLALPFIVMGSGIAELSKISSADSLAVFIGMLCILALLKRSRMVFVLAAILPAMRTDYVLISILVLLVEFIREKRAASIISAAAALIVYISINKFAGNYGWLTLFNHSVIAATPYPANLAPSSNWMDYVRPYANATYDMISSSASIVYVVAIYFVFSHLLKEPGVPTMSRISRYVIVVCRKDIRSTALLIVPILFVAGHLLMFPDYEPRYFVLSAALALVWILSKGTIKGLAPWQRTRSSTESPASVAAFDPSLHPA